MRERKKERKIETMRMASDLMSVFKKIFQILWSGKVVKKIPVESELLTLRSVADSLSI